MEKTKIDWCDSSWNPVTGCYHDCEYCYARSIANRFSGNKTADNIRVELNDRIYSEKTKKNEAYPYGFVPTLHRYRLDEYEKKGGRNIFVCSMADLFGTWVPDSWIEEVFAACEKAPQHNYLFLTKNPYRYVLLQEKNKLPSADNMWYGASATDEGEIRFAAKMLKRLNHDTKSFLSIEPMLEDITSSDAWEFCISEHIVDWVIVGAETGNRKNKIIPERDWIESIFHDCQREDIPVFMKSSLTNVWERPLLQDFPKELWR